MMRAFEVVKGSSCLTSGKSSAYQFSNGKASPTSARTTFSQKVLAYLQPFCQCRRRKSTKKSSASSFVGGKIFLTSTVTISTSSLHNMAPKIQATPYLWPAGEGATFDTSTVALVVIDMQNDFCAPGGYIEAQGYNISSARAIIPRIQKLLQAFRSQGLPIYFTREGHRPDLSTLSSREHTRSRLNASGLGIGDTGPLGRLLIRGEKGHDIIPEVYPLQGENIIEKPGRSAFQHTEFRLMLDIRGIKNLIICGVTTDVCVHSTMREANDNNFDCLLVEDATAASEPELHAGAVASVKAEGGIFGAVSSTEQILAMFSSTASAKQDIPVLVGNGHAL